MSKYTELFKVSNALIPCGEKPAAGLEVGPWNVHRGMVTSPYSCEDCYSSFNVHTGQEGFAILWSHLKDPYIVNCMELNLSVSERSEGFVAHVPINLRNSVNIYLHIHAAPFSFLKIIKITKSMIIRLIQMKTH